MARRLSARISWQRPGGGGGRTRVLADGGVFEKAGVNFSEVFGQMSPEFAEQIPGEGLDFTAAGVSLVLHPRSPMVPTVHANFRFLTKGTKWWFGGGADLTPVLSLSRRRDPFPPHLAKRSARGHPAPVDYARFKKWCDEYFYLPHRQESRGVGGIFFDYLEGDFATPCSRSSKTAATPSSTPTCRSSQTAQTKPTRERERFFQEFRRGRYVEFNLIYDRGTIFGLKTGGRTESILMSLPPVVRWQYDYQPAPGSREAEIYEYIKPRLGE